MWNETVAEWKLNVTENMILCWKGKNKHMIVESAGENTERTVSRRDRAVIEVHKQDSQV